MAVSGDSRVTHMQSMLARPLLQLLLPPLAEIRKVALAAEEEQHALASRKGEDGLAWGASLFQLRPGRPREDFWIPRRRPSHLPWIPRPSGPWRERHSFPHPWRERHSPLLMHLVEATSAAEAAAEVAVEAALGCLHHVLLRQGFPSQPSFSCCPNSSHRRWTFFELLPHPEVGGGSQARRASRLRMAM